MKCLSIRQPWSWLIMHNYKDVENRTWRVNTSKPSWILIHASKKYEGGVLDRLFDKGIITAQTYGEAAKSKEQLGCILGEALLYSISTQNVSLWAEPNCYHWYFLATTLFVEPIPYKGKLGLFDVPEHILPIITVGEYEPSKQTR